MRQNRLNRALLMSHGIGHAERHRFKLTPLATCGRHAPPPLVGALAVSKSNQKLFFLSTYTSRIEIINFHSSFTQAGKRAGAVSEKKTKDTQPLIDYLKSCSMTRSGQVHSVTPEKVRCALNNNFFYSFFRFGLVWWGE